MAVDKAAVIVEDHEDEEEYTDEQFEADVERARGPLQAMAEKALKSLRDGTAMKFPQ